MISFFAPSPTTERTTMSNITITAADLCTLASDEGCDVLEQKSWFKITSGENRKAIYVAKSKRVITKIHFSGFMPEECEVIQQLSKEEAKELSLGAVRGEINTKNLRGEDLEASILEAFEANLALLRNEEDGFKAGKKKEEEASEDATVDVDFEALSGLSQMAADEE